MGPIKSVAVKDAGVVEAGAAVEVVTGSAVAAAAAEGIVLEAAARCSKPATDTAVD